jgi:mRNA-degrading endonuclease RelE of RelBE toxin-antitoxin system
VDLACGLTESKYPGLATLLARGVATTTRFWEAELLLEAIAKLRDRLDLPPEDPAEWVLDRHYDLPEDLDEATHEGLADAQQEMGLKDAEVNRLRTQLAEARAQLERQERLARARPTPAASAVTPAPISEPTDATLRMRIEELKSALKERHAERNTLRRELSEALKEAAELREAMASDAEQTPATADAAVEELQLLPEEQTAVQPVRLPFFPPRFSPALARLPQHVVRSAMALIGKLAAGEPEAFVGIRRLRVRREICRARVGADYRLLFKALDDRLEVMDLINRKDFEKWLKTQT